MSAFLKDIETNHTSCGCNFVFVDDGSSDKSLQILKKEISLTSARFQVLHFSQNAGKSSAVNSALRECSTTHAVILDADLELKSSDVHRMWQLVTDGVADSVFGIRSFLAHNSFTYRYTLGNKLVSHWFSMCFNVVFSDVMCGLKLIPLELFQNENLKLKKFALEIEIPILLWRSGLVPHELFVEYEPRGWEEGKVIGIRDALYILFFIPFLRIQLWNKRPKFFKQTLKKLDNLNSQT